MSGKDIRKFEFTANKAQVFINKDGKLQYKGKRGGKKDLKNLQPLFDAILKADNSFMCHNKKLDSAKEEALMQKLHTLLMADSNVDANELKLGDEFQKSGLPVEAFIDKKLSEAKGTVDDTTSEVEDEENTEKAEDTNTNTVQNQEENVEEQINVEIPEQAPAPSRPDPRVSANAFNQSIQNQKVRIQNRYDELNAHYTKTIKLDRGDSLYKIAKQTLRGEGIEKPTPKQINDRITEIALINDIDNVNNIQVGMSLRLSSAPAGAGSTANSSTTSEIPSSVAPSSIEVADKNAAETLTELGYTAEEKTVEAEGENEAFSYKEWTKEGSDTMYTTDVNGGGGLTIVLTAESLEKLKELKKSYDEAAITDSLDGEETEVAKAARQTKNLDNLKKRIELAGGDKDAIAYVIDKLKTEGVVKLDSPEVQAFVQELIRTKNVDILADLLPYTAAEGETPESLNVSLLANDKTSAETLVSLYKEIRDKENAGIKLTDKEIALKNFFKEKVQGHSLYTVQADEEKGIAEKSLIGSSSFANNVYRSTVNGIEIIASDPAILDAFVKEFKAADTDEKKAALFKKYTQTDDKVLAQTLAYIADTLCAKKEDVLALVNKNDMYVLKELSYTPDEADAAAFNKAVADRIVAIYEAANADPANMRYLEQAFAKIDAAVYSENEEDNTAAKEAAKTKILETFFEVTKTTEGEGENAVTIKSYVFKPLRRPTYEEMEKLLPYLNADQQKAVLNSIPSIDDLGAGQYTQLLETQAQHITTADLKAKYSELFDAVEFDLENDLEGARAKVLAFIDSVGPNIDLIPFDKIQEKFGDVEFVKEHLGPQKNENSNILRKLTLLDLDIKESRPDADGKVTYSVDFSIAIEDYDSSYMEKVSLSANSKEELLAKAKPYIELQNMVYENSSPGSKATDTEISINLARLEEMFNDENMDRDLKLAIVNYVVGLRGVYSEGLIDAIIETKDPDFIKIEALGWYGDKLTDAQAAKLIEYAKDPKLADGTNNPLYLGTESGNYIRDAIIRRRDKKEEILAIYDSLRLNDQLDVLSIHTEYFDNAVDRLEQLINKVLETNDPSVAFFDILKLAMNKGLTLSKETADKLMSKIQRPLPVHEGREPIYSWANGRGDTVYYRKQTDSNGRVKFVKCSADDYAAEIKYEIDNNGASHKKEKRQAEALSRLSSSGVADVILAYQKNGGKGIIRAWNDEYAWFGDALGVDDMLPVIKKILEYGSPSDKNSDEYKALEKLVKPYMDEHGNSNTTKDFKSDIASQIDNAMIAYIKKVRNIE